MFLWRDGEFGTSKVRRVIVFSKRVSTGGVKAGQANTRVGFGSLNRPTNILGISPETIATLGSSGAFNQARGTLLYCTLCGCANMVVLFDVFEFCNAVPLCLYFDTLDSLARDF
jgi:hypothetical protein